MRGPITDDAILLLWETGEISEGQAVLLFWVEDRVRAREIRQQRLDYCKEWIAKNIDWPVLKEKYRDLHARAGKGEGSYES